MLWWIWLLIIAFYFYNWVKEHVGFSPLLTLAVSGVLIYYMVIEYPWLGSLSFITMMLLTSGILYLLPWVLPFFFGHKPEQQQ
jgi:hypothetical protein